jgi:aldose 1-epimerase
MMTRGPADIRGFADARTLRAGDLEAVFLPGHGMLGASLVHRGAQILRRVDDLARSAADGTTAGIPILHPWANRLDRARYRACGRDVALDLASPLLHADGNGLPIHGVPWARLAWTVTESSPARIAARLDWTRSDLLALFPYPHALEMVAALDAEGLTLATTLVAGGDGPVPVSFGFHPYLGLPGPPRAQWRLRLPAMRRLALDRRGIPTNADEPFAGLDATLGERAFDDGFALIGETARMSIAGAGRSIAVEWLEGFPYAQVFAPPAHALVALEPMTAPANALVSGRGLRFAAPGQSFRTAFRISVASLP